MGLVSPGKPGKVPSGTSAQTFSLSIAAKTAHCAPAPCRRDSAGHPLQHRTQQAQQSRPVPRRGIFVACVKAGTIELAGVEPDSEAIGTGTLCCCSKRFQCTLLGTDFQEAIPFFVAYGSIVIDRGEGRDEEAVPYCNEHRS
jgi:hypothetical protein